MLKIRTDLIPHMKHALGSGSEIDFWSDPWCRKGKILDALGDQVMEELGSRNSKVARYINGKQWVLPQSLILEVNQFWSYISSPEIPKAGYFADSWVWLHSVDGVFTFKGAFNALRVQHPEKDWAKIVWPSSSIPKHSCCSFRAVLGQLLTKDHMGWLNTNLDPCCVLCKTESETHEHLFFGCSYSSYFWQRCRLKLGLRLWRRCSKSSEIADLLKSCKEDNQCSELRKLVFNAAIWFLWRERNDRIFNNIFTHKSKLFD